MATDLLAILLQATELCYRVQNNPRYKKQDRLMAERLFKNVALYCSDTIDEYGDVLGKDERTIVRRISFVELKKHAQRGKKVRDAARRGHEITHGTKAERQKEYEKWQQYVEKCLLLHPDWSYDHALHKIAEATGKSYVTIKRHTHRPKNLQNI